MSPETVSGVPDSLLFFEKLRVEMAAFPPATPDQHTKIGSVRWACSTRTLPTWTQTRSWSMD